MHVSLSWTNPGRHTLGSSATSAPTLKTKIKWSESVLEMHWCEQFCLLQFWGVNLGCGEILLRRTYELLHKMSNCSHQLHIKVLRKWEAFTGSFTTHYFTLCLSRPATPPMRVAILQIFLIQTQHAIRVWHLLVKIWTYRHPQLLDWKLIHSYPVFSSQIA